MRRPHLVQRTSPSSSSSESSSLFFFAYFESPVLSTFNVSRRKQRGHVRAARRSRFARARRATQNGATEPQNSTHASPIRSPVPKRLLHFAPETRASRVALSSASFVR